MALSIIHFILFAYNQEKRANLIYAVGILMVFVNYTFKLPLSEGQAEVSTKSTILINIITTTVLLYFVAQFYIDLKTLIRKPGFLILTGFFFTGLLYILFTPDIASEFSSRVVILFRGGVYLTVFFVCIKGLVQRVPNFFIIAAGTLLLGFTDIFVSFDIFGWWPQHEPARAFLILSGYSTPFVFYSVYLSKDLAVTSKKLQNESFLNVKLSREKLEQEKITMKLLEEQNLMLEKNVEERTREIIFQKNEISQQAEKIKEMEKKKSRFFSNISHEFRTPLTVILGTLEQRADQSSNQEEKLKFSIVERNALRLLRLVNQLLDLSRIESSTMLLKTTERDFIAFSKKAAEPFGPLFGSKNIQFHFETSLQELKLFFDQDKMEKIIHNLLSNAYKYTDSGGSISLKISEGKPDHNFVDGFAQLMIKDTGIGIAMEHVAKIFDRFYQIDQTAVPSHEGSGIGLALTKEFVELHHGTITLDSEKGRGTNINLLFPLGKKHLSSQEILDIDPEYIGQKNVISSLELPTLQDSYPLDKNIFEKSILIVEDNYDLRYFLKENLADRYFILEAENGEEGLQLARKEVPDLILSDLMMPKMDGFEFCQKIKTLEITSHIPFILLTAKIEMDSKLEGLQIGADDYIPKPFNMKELQVRIKNLLTGRKKFQEKYEREILLKPKDLHLQSADDKFLEKVSKTLESNLEDPLFGVDRFASEVGYSTVQFYRKISALTGHTPNEFIRLFRLQRAADLLKQKVGNVSEIAYQVGFNNLSYFSKVFKEKYGISPNLYGKS